MEEKEIRNKLLKKSSILLSIIEILSIIVLFISNSKPIYYLMVIVINLIVYLFISFVSKKKLSGLQYENQGIIQKFNFRILLSYIIFPIIFLSLSFFLPLKVFAISTSIISFSFIAYFFKQDLLKIENKVARYDYDKKNIYIINNKIFSDTFLLTIPILLDVYNMMFSFNIKYFSIILLAYFAIIIGTILYHIKKQSGGDPNKK